MNFYFGDRRVVVMHVPSVHYPRCLRPGQDILEEINLTGVQNELDIFGETLHHWGYTAVVSNVNQHLPDSIFARDAAWVLEGPQGNKLVLVLPMADTSRREESVGWARFYRNFLPYHHGWEVHELKLNDHDHGIEGGDIIEAVPLEEFSSARRTLFVGIGERTSMLAYREFSRIADYYGYQTVAVDVVGALHLSSWATVLGNCLLCQPDKFDVSKFEDFGFRIIEVQDEWSANVLPITSENVAWHLADPDRRAVIVPEQFYSTTDVLSSMGVRTVRLPLTNVVRGSGGPTCLAVELGTFPMYSSTGH